MEIANNIMTEKKSIIEIKQFDLNELSPNPFIIMIGQEQHKKIIMDNIINKFQNMPSIAIINETGNMCIDQKGKPNIMVYTECKQEILNKIIDRQKTIISQKPEKDCRLMLILDDFDKYLKINIDTNSLDIDTPFKEIIFEHKKLQISIIINMTYPIYMIPEYRVAVDYVFLSPYDTNIREYSKTIYEQYAGIFPKFNLFKKIFDEITKNNNSLVLIKNICPSNFSFTDRVKYI